MFLEAVAARSQYVPLSHPRARVMGTSQPPPSSHPLSEGYFRKKKSLFHDILAEPADFGGKRGHLTALRGYGWDES